MATTVEFLRDYGVEIRANGQKRWPDEVTPSTTEPLGMLNTLATAVLPSHTFAMEDAMTIKSSISLRDDQHAFARALVEGGRFPSVSAVVQQGLDLLRQQDADVQADRAALRAILAERADGPFVTGDDLRARLAARRAE